MTDIIGIMTGNSLDGADVVLTSFENGGMRDIAGYSLPFSETVSENLRRVRRLITEKGADMEAVARDGFFRRTVREYTELAAEAVHELMRRSGRSASDIAAIGFHGQTCDHFPPSIARGEEPYTVQVGDAALLADRTGIPVIYDFRSDDVMNGGEGAPLAPVHNRHVAEDLKARGLFPIAFCNAGNTGNIAVISERAGGPVVLGWDTGPFNHFPDALMRRHKREACDRDGLYGALGQVTPDLLKIMFDGSAVNSGGENFFLQPPPRSSDPSWYRLPPETEEFRFENVLRTAEYLGAYAFMHALSFVPEDVEMPSTFLLFGGGWKNPLTLQDFKDLLNGRGLMLPEHEDAFAVVRRRFAKQPSVEWSDVFGCSGTYMEARIFADMAFRRITGEPFSYPESTGCASPTVSGICVFPSQGGGVQLKELMRHYGTEKIVGQKGADEPPHLYSRAVRGWKKKYAVPS